MVLFSLRKKKMSCEYILNNKIKHRPYEMRTERKQTKTTPAKEIKLLNLQSHVNKQAEDVV